jgi:hypothetical protein
MKWILYGVFNFCLLACAPPALQRTDWHSGDDIRDLQFLNDIQTPVPQNFDVLNERIEFSIQNFSGIPVANTFIKKINHRDGKLLAVNAQYETRSQKLLLLPTGKFKDLSQARENIQERFSFLKSQDLSSLAPLIISPKQIIWKIEYFTVEGVPHVLKLDQNYQVLENKIAGANWLDRPAFIFPAGPKFSALKEVSIKNISFSPALSNPAYAITSAIPANFNESEKVLRYSAEDSRFDQLQAYFFVEQTLDWIKNHLGIQIPFPLDIQLHVGYPEKTNAAFYYSGKIRLGAGDDVVYTKIPQDPTIVSHEVFHALVEALARLPFEGEGGSLNEAFADYFTSQQLKKPELGDTAYLAGPFKRSLNITKKMDEKTGGLYGDSLIISSLLWELTQRLPSDKIHKVALKTLSHLNPVSTFADFNRECQAALTEYLDAAELTKAKNILRTRGFIL